MGLRSDSSRCGFLIGGFKIVIYACSYCTGARFIVILRGK